VRNEAGVPLRTAEEEMHRWKELLNLPEVESGNELNVKTGRITRFKKEKEE